MTTATRAQLVTLRRVRVLSTLMDLEPATAELVASSMRHASQVTVYRDLCYHEQGGRVVRAGVADEPWSPVLWRCV